MTRISRRQVLAGGLVGVGVVTGTALGVEQGVLPGRTRFYAGVGLNGPDTPPAETTSGVTVQGGFYSQHREVQVSWAIAYPPGIAVGDSLPVVVGLHGRFNDHTALFGDQIGLDRYLAAVSPPYAIAAIDGGDTYWHPLASGEDAGAMVMEEFIPLLTARGLQTGRIGLYGYSMGGYGALRIAGILGPSRVAAVATVSAALWTRAGDTAPGAFDDPADFAAHNVVDHQDDLDGIPVRIDCGRGDGFAPANRRYRNGFNRQPAGGLTEGAHDLSYWRRMAPAELEFLGQHLLG